MSVIYVLGRGSISAGGPDHQSLISSLQVASPRVSWQAGLPIFPLAEAAEARLALLAKERGLRLQDRVTQLAVLAAREAWADGQLGGERGGVTGVVFGSSRGVTSLLEESHARFMAGERLHPASSPVTTPSAIPTAIARDLQLHGPNLFVSAACCTGLHAIGMASALLTAGQANYCLAGGAEAPLTPFTLGMLQAAKVYADSQVGESFPCRPMHEERRGMVMGEGAAALLLSREAAPGLAKARVVAFAATNEETGLAGVNGDGQGLQMAIGQALTQAGLEAHDIALVVGHGSSTRLGDAAERQAYQQVFGQRLPMFVFHKWLLGHALGASATVSAAAAVDHMLSGCVPPHPYGVKGDPWQLAEARTDCDLPYALVTALGFGGNAAALILARG